MIKIDELISKNVKEAINNIYSANIEDDKIQVQHTRKDFTGDFTLVVFPLLKTTKQKPEQTAEQIGDYLVNNLDEIATYNIIKGFLNLTVSDNCWLQIFEKICQTKNYGCLPENSSGKSIMIEYSSPNTNKPLHLGHVRNNLLGFALANIMQANGHQIIKSNLINDRGIHICKTMLAWQKWGKGETPQSSGTKGDHLVGAYYVRFEQALKTQVDEMIAEGTEKDVAIRTAPLIQEAQEMLRKWEAGDEAVVDLWKTMNNWVYEGFDETYKKLGVDFDKIYYESQTYKKGRDIVLEGLQNGALFKKDNGSVWADLTGDGLDEKLLLRADGTSVYMTQDIGTAIQRFEDFDLDKIIYVVGNEQDYHFKVLPIILRKLGYKNASNLEHLSYGMVDLPSGKMKSREGKVVDADDLVDEMVETAKKMSAELGKLDNYTNIEQNNIIKTIGLGALKYFILKVDPKKNMTFNPEESVDFNGNTGPFIQYTFARIQSLKAKAAEKDISIPENVPSITLNNAERELIKKMYQYPDSVQEAGKAMNPGIIANYTYDLVKQYNQFYQEHPVLKNEDETVIHFRLMISHLIGRIIQSSMKLLGIEVPPRM